MDILIIKSPHAENILDGKKLLEIRGSRTTKTGERIGIAVSGTGRVYGEVTIPDIIRFDEEKWEKFKWAHLAQCSFNEICQRYKQPWGWIMQDPIWYPKPKKYYHPAGAVIWVSSAMILEEDD